MNGDFSVSVDLSVLIATAIDRTLAVFGRDVISKERKSRLDKQIRIATKLASFVQWVGMDRPLPIQEIFQKSKLRSRTESVEIWDLLKRRSDGVITGGPGKGKTTLLRWFYIRLLQGEEYTPVLFTLRLPGAVEDLAEFVRELPASRLPSARRKLVLLVDGYDEVSENDRHKISSVLRDFMSLEIGMLFISCRLFYTVYDLPINYYAVEDFTIDDAWRFIVSFSRLYEAELNAGKILDELKDHGFSDFIGSPLMLTLVCILKAGPSPTLPRSTVGLIRRAIDTLTLRWDQSKGIARASNVLLDGEERVRCLMRVAFHMQEQEGPETEVYRVVSEFLRLAQHPEIDIGLLLTEMAQWYGFFVPAESSKWVFVHRAIHDFLAARFWVEGGLFIPSQVANWNARAAYAAALLPDATESLTLALDQQDGLYAASECFYNNAPLQADKVAVAIEGYFAKFRGVFWIKRKEGESTAVETRINHDFFHLLSEPLLTALLVRVASNLAKVHNEALFVYGVHEALMRGLKLNDRGLLKPFKARYHPRSSFSLARRDRWHNLIYKDVAHILQPRVES